MAKRKAAARRAAAAPVRSEPKRMTREQRARFGQNLRRTVPRSAHADWNVAAARRDPVAILEQSNRGRLSDLIPVRYGRMLRTPFAFLRGAASVMAHDLARTPSTGLAVQLCGDCHLLNFGVFATPEQRLVFDLNDFDETNPGPWEWDLKRLAASIVVAGREARLSKAQCRAAVLACVEDYRNCVRDCSRMTPLEVWHSCLEWEALIGRIDDARTRRLAEQFAERARHHVAEHLFPKITKDSRGRSWFVDQPPLLFHADRRKSEEHLRAALAAYRETLPADRRVLVDRFRFADGAMKVAGIGSVGTRCYIALLLSDAGDPLVLQFKQALPSVLEPYTARSRYASHGERVVMGQRLMQSSSDIFLGWARGPDGKDFYVRHLRDVKLMISVESLSPEQFTGYAGLCGVALARAHAASGDAAAISGYLGGSVRFDRAIARFAASYADQTERDHAALVKAVQSGRIHAVAEV